MLEARRSDHQGLVEGSPSLVGQLGSLGAGVIGGVIVSFRETGFALERQRL